MGVRRSVGSGPAPIPEGSCSGQRGSIAGTCCSGMRLGEGDQQTIWYNVCKSRGSKQGVSFSGARVRACSPRAGTGQGGCSSTGIVVEYITDLVLCVPCRYLRFWCRGGASSEVGGFHDSDCTPVGTQTKLRCNGP